MNENSAEIRYVAIGDSFSEGMGDSYPDGTVRGWADLAAQEIANQTGKPVQYANLAIRGKLLQQIIDEQLDAALALNPTMVSFNGGGNNMMRPRTDIQGLSEMISYICTRIQDAGAQPLLVAGPNPAHNPFFNEAIIKRGDALVENAAQIALKHDTIFANQWADTVLHTSQYWDTDRLHLNTHGHQRVASNVLATLGYTAPYAWRTEKPAYPAPTAKEQLEYTREYVVPWLGRRLTKRSSGDGRAPKFPAWITLEPK